MSQSAETFKTHDKFKRDQSNTNTHTLRNISVRVKGC
uniref:Uncharacterized protein n=1 Tax=Anguilla anguilla TaxID=7936 RepID=A0A0E9TKV6_ANGAN